MTRPYSLETLGDSAIATALSAGLIDQDTADAARGAAVFGIAASSWRRARQRVVDALNAAVPAGAIRPSLGSQPAGAVVRGATYSPRVEALLGRLGGDLSSAADCRDLALALLDLACLSLSAQERVAAIVAEELP